MMKGELVKRTKLKEMRSSRKWKPSSGIRSS